MISKALKSVKERLFSRHDFKVARLLFFVFIGVDVVLFHGLISILFETADWRDDCSNLLPSLLFRHLAGPLFTCDHCQSEELFDIVFFLVVFVFVSFLLVVLGFLALPLVLLLRLALVFEVLLDKFIFFFISGIDVASTRPC